MKVNVIVSGTFYYGIELDIPKCNSGKIHEAAWEEVEQMRLTEINTDNVEYQVYNERKSDYE